MSMDEIMRHIVKMNTMGGESLDAEDHLDPKRGHNKDSEYVEYDNQL